MIHKRPSDYFVIGCLISIIFPRDLNISSSYRHIVFRSMNFPLYLSKTPSPMLISPKHLYSSNTLHSQFVSHFPSNFFMVDLFIVCRSFIRYFMICWHFAYLNYVHVAFVELGHILCMMHSATQQKYMKLR